jgi:hypothetical protein
LKEHKTNKKKQTKSDASNGTLMSDVLDALDGRERAQILRIGQFWHQKVRVIDIALLSE